MARHKRQHHRKVKQERFTGQTSPAITPAIEPEEVALATPSAESQIVKKDLQMTLYTVVGLLVVLIIAAVVNHQYQWTTSFGVDLYRWLNIR